jgi:pimeloyl-ACP methyl ester carboxylesterase
VGRKLEASIAVLNGAIGDYLARTGNGLATPMTLLAQPNGERIDLDRNGIQRAIPQAGPRVALFVHGLMSSEGVWTMADGGDYGSRLARTLGITPIYLRYNSGLPIADNGASLSRCIEALIREYPAPIERLVAVGHSMGGLVVRSACHAAGLGERRWLGLLEKAIYVGTPHLGAPLERAGRIVSRILRAIDDPYTRLVGELADLRSDGLKDLGDADLRHEDRAAKGARLRDARHPVPLLPGIQHYLIAGTLSDTTWLGPLVGDSVVPLESATAGLFDPSALPPSHVRVFSGINHIALAHDPSVYEAILGFCQEESP